LLKALRQEATTKKLLLTIATSPVRYNDIELSEIHQYVDFINVMCYDYFGPWDNKTGHNAPLIVNEKNKRAKLENGPSQWSVSDTIQAYLTAGVPAYKIVMGMPLYARSFAGVDPVDPLFGVSTGAGAGTVEAGSYSWQHIKSTLLKDPSFVKGYDEVSQVPYLYNASKKEFISYDDEESLRLKAKHIAEKNLGGAMVWQLENDAAIWSVLEVIHNGMNASN